MSRIAILCGCLEPGKDGVGDYSRRLAVDLVHRNTAVILVSLNDFHVSTESYENISGVDELRIPASYTQEEKYNIAAAFLKMFQPDLISLQIVSYGFNSRGILWNTIPFFNKLLKPYPLQVMFHELWLGAHAGATLFQKTIGGFQRYSILKLLGILKPKRIHVNCAAFQYMLSKNNIQSEILPLFGNIPVYPNPDFTWIYNAFSKNEIRLSQEKRKDYWAFLFFGAIDSSFNLASLSPDFLKLAKSTQRKILICSAGKSEAGILKWKNALGNNEEAILFHAFGELSEEKISNLMMFSDFGLTTYPKVLLGKSGSVAAMLEHSLPVVFFNNSLVIKGFTEKNKINRQLIDLNDLEKEINSYLVKENKEENLLLLKHASKMLIDLSGS